MIGDLVGLIVPGKWIDAALCAQADGDAFFPEKGDGPPRDAKRVCRACPVRLDCLRDALDRKEPFGVWGGFSPKEREDIARRRKKSGNAVVTAAVSGEFTPKAA